MISRGFEKVDQAFQAMLSEQLPKTQAQLAVFHQGKLVADLAGGAPGASATDSDTPFLCYSISKAFTAMAVMRLVEEGKLELDAPIGRYWPEFACRGKEDATLRHALLHQACIPAPHLYRQIFTWPFWTLVVRGVARETAQFPPGTQTAYHLVNFGFILGEVVRRVSGLPVDEFLSRYFLEPMGLKNTWMRIPAKNLRKSPRLITDSQEMTTAANLFNLRPVRRALLPAAGMHSTARELGAFFQMLLDGGKYLGISTLKPETINLAAQSYYDGYDSYIKTDVSWGLGLVMGGGAHQDPEPRNWIFGFGSSDATFGALGMGTSMVWADRREKLVTAFTCNNMLGDPQVAERWSSISNAVWECVR